jgi:dTDP-4-amino-4,6-dideoxygalactose transaminase
MSGEGGMLVINSSELNARSEIIREKGTNRNSFFRGEVNKYEWVDIGSSFLPSDIIAAFLYAQLENLKKIQKQRVSIWDSYYRELKELEFLGYIKIPIRFEDKTNNAHMFYIITKNNVERDELIKHLKNNQIHAVFHYLALHKSPFYKLKHDGRKLHNAEKFENRLLRLPLYFELSQNNIISITNAIKSFYINEKQS